MAGTHRDVPKSVEDYLVNRLTWADWVGTFPQSLVRMFQQTTVEQREGVVLGDSDRVVARVVSAFPKARRLPVEDRVRFAVPVGFLGSNRIVVDLVFGQGAPVQQGAGVHVRLWAYGKEPELSRRPTRRIADRAWSAVTSA